MTALSRPRDVESAGTARGLAFAAIVLAAGFTFGLLAQLGVPGLGGFATIWPQRWEFFTGLDRPSVVPYRLAGPGLPLSSWEMQGNGGLSRTAEIGNLQARKLAERVPEAYWQTCVRENAVDCGLDLDPDVAHRMKNQMAGLQLCGRVALAAEWTDVPPAGKLPAPPRRVHRIAVVEFECVP
ncbi:hypothetical protein SK854_32865 [Lentzea sp. BCCO 10_0061]|uniref:Uncharacterized protein n=1 Tax=Lentzea sokolovensis TaxID=3095429 RepID=A0ABU4V589_9PSEU|nr:hypothetical protein [Lentzea sp. BCCO 10_0061]MDX8146947.1 hypothetical protein [Lentzea sp. BCCO 10_0061]